MRVWEGVAPSNWWGLGEAFENFNENGCPLVQSGEYVIQN